MLKLSYPLLEMGAGYPVYLSWVAISYSLPNPAHFWGERRYPILAVNSGYRMVLPLRVVEKKGIVLVLDWDWFMKQKKTLPYIGKPTIFGF